MDIVSHLSYYYTTFDCYLFLFYGIRVFDIILIIDKFENEILVHFIKCTIQLKKIYIYICFNTFSMFKTKFSMN